MLEVSTSAVNFGEVAVNDIPSYRQIKLKNTRDTALNVSISCTSASVRFQLANENAFINANEMDDRMSYNELFDLVGLTDTISLGPKEERPIVAFFRAEKSSFGHLLPQSQPVALTGSINLTATLGDIDAATRGFPHVDLKEIGASSTDNAASGGSETRTQSAPPVTTVSQPVSPAVDHTELMQIPMNASVFLSQLQVTPVELQATMAPNKTQVLDFTVTNLGSRPLVFVVRSQTMAVKGLDIAVYEAERFEEPKLGHRLLLDSHASINLSVMLRTTASSFSHQQYKSILQCDNLCDADNTVLVNVNVNIVSESQGDLVSLSDTAINFGDVYRGSKAGVELGFLNVDGRGDVSISLNPSYKRKANGEILLAKDGNTTDELLIPAQKGMQYVKIVYKPAFVSELPQTEKVKFDLDFTATSVSNGRKQRLVVWCVASLFTSTIVVPQKNVDFGDCQVGESKRRTFTIENQSPLPGNVLFQIRSKIISIEGASSKQNASGSRDICEEFTIGPSSKLAVTLRITPQRVNPTYRKQLSVVNMTNPNEDKQIINIEANNMAPPEAKMHNELYTWDCRLPGGLSQFQPLCTISNMPALVPYTVKSKTTELVSLSIKTTCPEIDVFCCTDPAKTQQLEAIASEWRSYCVYGKENEVNDLVNTPPERIEELRDSLMSLLTENGVVVAQVPLAPKSTVTLFAVIIRSTVTTDAHTKEDGLLISVEGVETPRFVRLSYRLCGSLFDLLGQKTKNFGEVNIGVKKTTKVPVENKCKSVLFVKIEKSRSVTAGHVRIEHTEKQMIYLVVRPFATKEVELSFLPGIKGNFDEKIKLTNLLDPMNNYTLTLKATVVKADTFDVSPDSWNFGTVMLPPLNDPLQLTRIGAKFMVTNTSKAKRQIRVKLGVSGTVASSTHGAADPLALLREMSSRWFGFSGVDVRIQLEMELSNAGTGSARKIEEQIEKLEQKLKIHERKKKWEKMEAVKKRIEELKRTLQGEEVDLTALAGATADHDYSESEDEAAPQAKEYSQSTELMMQLLRDGAPLPSMGAGESVAITFGLTCARLPDQPAPLVQTTTLNLLLYEVKDQEVSRIFPIDITLVRPEEEEPDVHASSAAVSAAAHGVGTGPAQRSSIIFLESGDPGRAVSTFMGNPLVVLRNTIVNDHTELTFVVKASSNTTVVVLEPRRCGGAISETLDARFKFFPRNGTVGANEELRIVAECTPRSVGPQKYFVPIKNLQNAADVQYFVIELNPTEEEERVIADPKQLIFQDLITPCDPKTLEAQLVLIRSRFHFPHSLLVRTNKPSQVLLFEDAQCQIPLRNPIQRMFMRETVRVFAKFSPSPKSNHANARQVRAGIVVEAIVANGEGRYTTIGQSVVDVTARVGSGLLEAPSTKLQFGPVGPNESVVTAAVPLTNPSDTFAVRTKIVAESGNLAVDTPDVVSLRPRETREFPVRLLLRSRGLYQEYVSFRNLTCRQEPITVELCLFQRDDAITAVTRPSPSGDYVLRVAAVARGPDGSFHLHSNPSTTIAIRNSSVKDIILASQCPLPFFLSSAEDHDHAEARRGAHATALSRGSSPSSPTSGGGRVRSAAQQTQKVTWTLLDVPEMDGLQIGRLLRCELVEIRGVAQVQVAQIEDESRIDFNFFRVKPQFPSIGQCVLLLPFVVPVAISEGRAEPTLVNLGLVGQGEEEEDSSGAADNAGGRFAGSRGQLIWRGHADDESSDGTVTFAKERGEKKQRQSSAVKVTLMNLSQHLPLQLTVESQPIIRFSNTRITLRPGESTEVEAKLRIKEIPTQGPFRYEAFFVNALNPENDIAVTIIGQYYWKVFRLSTKAIDDLHETLTMPPLHVEGSSAIPTVLCEERLTVSATEPDVELQLRVQNNPKLEGLVQLQVLHYDATSSVETLTFRGERATDGDSEAGSARADGDVEDGEDGASASNAGGGGADGGVGADNGGVAAGIGAAGPGPGAGAATAGGSGAAQGGTTPASQAQRDQQQGAGAGSAGVPVSRRKGQPPRPPQQQKAQTVRVRCVLLRSDLGHLANSFTGFRKKGGSAEALTFDKIPELEKRRSTPAFSNAWLGTITFSNRLTKKEDITVFGQLDPFTTFVAPSKLSLEPSRVAAATPTSPTPRHHLVYTGELRITNNCEKYLAELAATALISDQLTMPTTVQITSAEETLAEEQQTKPSVPPPATAELSRNDSFRDVLLLESTSSMGENGSTAAISGAGKSSTITSLFTNAPSGGAAKPSMGVASQKVVVPPSQEHQTQPKPVQEGPLCHRVRLGPKATAVLRILVYSNNPFDMKNIQQSSLEQLIALAVVDENVISSASVVRLNVTPLEGDVEEAPLYKGASVFDSNAALAGGVVAAPSLFPSEEKCEVSPIEQSSIVSFTIPEIRGDCSPARASVGAAPALPSGAAGASVPSGGGGNAADSRETSARLGDTGASLSNISNANIAASASTVVGTAGGETGSGGGAVSVGMGDVVVGPPVASLAKHVISLKGCTAVSDCPGAYSISFSVPRGEAPQGDIAIRNNLPDRTVQYTTSVTSQSPLSWILLPSSTGALEAGETQTLRLNLVTSEVGSFVGYVAVHNNANPNEVVYLRLSAEVFVPSSGEGLFEVVTTSGYRVASNEVRNVFLGNLYGPRAGRAYIALELVNRSNVPLEFPVSVVKPFRVDTKPVRDSGSLAGLYQPHLRRHHHNRPHSARRVSGAREGKALPNALSSGNQAETPLDGGDAAVAPPITRAPSSFPGTKPVFEGKLITCHIHGVPTQASQKYIVVDPKSRVRLAFVLSCLELRVPDGYGVFGEADVIFKCKQARDANFTFRVRFEAYAPTFQVNQEVEFGPDEDYTQVAVKNSLNVPQAFVFRSQSPVLLVVPGTGSRAGDEAAFAAAAAANKAAKPSSFASIEVRGNATGYFAVRIDLLKAAALNNYDKDDQLTRPSLCEHGFILSAHNPRERVRMQFHHGLSGAGGGGGGEPRQGRCIASQTLVVPSNSPAPILGNSMISTSVAKPVKVGGQHIGEHFIMRFAQEFASTLSFYEERLMATFARCGARRDGGPPGAGVTVSEEESDSESTASADTASHSSEDTHTTAPSATPAPADLDSSGSHALGKTHSDPPTTTTSTPNEPEGREERVVTSVPTCRSTGDLLPLAGTVGNNSLEGSVKTTGSVSPPRDSAVAGSGQGRTSAALSSPQQENFTTRDTAKTSHTTGGRATREERRCGLPSTGWKSLRALLLDLTWLVDELVFYSILLRNSRLIQGYCVFLAAAVCNHPVMRAWRQYRADLPAQFNVFAEYLEILDFLPCSMPS